MMLDCNFLETFLALVGLNWRVELTLEKGLDFGQGDAFSAVDLAAWEVQPSPSRGHASFCCNWMAWFSSFFPRCEKKVAMIWFRRGKFFLLRFVVQFLCESLHENMQSKIEFILFFQLTRRNSVLFYFSWWHLFHVVSFSCLELCSVSLRKWFLGLGCLAFRSRLRYFLDAFHKPTNQSYLMEQPWSLLVRCILYFGTVWFLWISKMFCCFGSSQVKIRCCYLHRAFRIIGRS